MRKDLLPLAFILFLALSSFTKDIGGKWSGTIAGQFEVVVNIKEEENGKLSGIVSTVLGEVPLKDGKVEGNDILFKEHSHYGISVSYIKGKIEGDKINITVEFQGQELKGTLVRMKQ